MIKAAASTDARLPEGHLERFEAKLARIGTAEEDTPAVTETVTSNPKSSSSRILRFTAFLATAAAAIAAVIFITRPAPQQPTDWFAGVADDPVEICQVYYEKAAALSGDILKKDPEGSLTTTVMSLSDSAVPMIDQLPDEMDDAARAEVLRHYYAELLDGLDKINKNI